MTIIEFMEALQDYGDEVAAGFRDDYRHPTRWSLSRGEWEHYIGWPTISDVSVADGAVSSVYLDAIRIDHSGIPLDELLALIRRHVDRRTGRGRAGDP